MSATDCLKHSWLQACTHQKTTNSAESDGSECELELIVDDLDLPDLQKEDELSSCSGTPDSILLSTSTNREPSPRPSAAYLSTKRASLDMSKDNLKEFVTRYSDNPYVFDSPRGIISHVNGGDRATTPKRFHTLKTPERSNSSSRSLLKQTSPPPLAEGKTDGINLVNQIRRFSKQLHEELEIMKKQCHQDCTVNGNNNNALRKCSWGDVSVNAHWTVLWINCSLRLWYIYLFR